MDLYEGDSVYQIGICALAGTPRFAATSLVIVYQIGICALAGTKSSSAGSSFSVYQFGICALIGSVTAPALANFRFLLVFRVFQGTGHSAGDVNENRVGHRYEDFSGRAKRVPGQKSSRGASVRDTARSSLSHTCGVSRAATAAPASVSAHRAALLNR